MCLAVNRLECINNLPTLQERYILASFLRTLPNKIRTIEDFMRGQGGRIPDEGEKLLPHPNPLLRRRGGRANPRPTGEREEFLNERSEFRNSGEGDEHLPYPSPPNKYQEGGVNGKH